MNKTKLNKKLNKIRAVILLQKVPIIMKMKI